MDFLNGLPKQCLRGIFLSFFQATLSGFFYFFSLYFVSDLHISLTNAGIILSCYGLGTILGGLVSGKLSDHFSPLMISLSGLIIQSATLLVLVQLNSIHLLMINLFILGFASYLFITANYVWVLNQCTHSEKEKLRVINLLSITSNLGIGLATCLVSFIQLIGFKLIILISASLLLLISTFIFIMHEKNNFFVAPYDKNITISTSHKEPIDFHKTSIWIAIICLFFTGMIVSQISTTYPIYVTAKFPHLGVHAFGVLFTVNIILVVFLQNNLVNRFSGKNKLLMIGIGSFFIGLGMMMLNFSSLFLAAVLACIVYTMGEMIFFSMVQLLCYQKAKLNKKGTALGIYRTVYASSRFAGPSMGAWIYHAFNANVLWYISGLVGMFFLCFCYAKKNTSNF